MADQDIDLDDLDDFADLYDEEPAPAAKPEPIKAETDVQAPGLELNEAFKTDDTNDFNIKTELDHDVEYHTPPVINDKPIGMKDDGKMFIGGLNWETTDQSLKDYFSQFGEVIDCQVMRDGATGRSRGFGFLTFKDPKTVNIVMVKEHTLDGKLIDPKRAIPREEQERTAKIFVGGVSQECTDSEFKEFFEQFGRVLDATLMMDKDTGRPRGFGFVTFDSDAAVDRVLAQDHEIHNKWIEVKRAEPRGNVRDGEGGRGGFGRGNRGGGNFGNSDNNRQSDNGGNVGNNNFSQSQMAQYWQQMQNYFRQMQTMTAANANPPAMNPMMQQQMMMQQMMQAQRGGQMNPQMMQQMQNMQGNMQGGGGYPGMPNPGSPMNGGAGAPRPAFTAVDQLAFEQSKYERQQNMRMQSDSFQGGNTWEGMYDGVPPPNSMRGRGDLRGIGYGGRGSRGSGSQDDGTPPQPSGHAPAGAPTGPKNAGQPGANYRGGGRGGRRGYHPYARGNHPQM